VIDLARGQAQLSQTQARIEQASAKYDYQAQIANFELPDWSVALMCRPVHLFTMQPHTTPWPPP